MTPITYNAATQTFPFAPFRNSWIEAKCVALFLEKVARGLVSSKNNPDLTNIVSYLNDNSEMKAMSALLQGPRSAILPCSRKKAHQLALTITKKLQESAKIDPMATNTLEAGITSACNQQTLLLEYSGSLKALQTAIYTKIQDKPDVTPIQNIERLSEEDLIQQITAWLNTHQELIGSITELDLSDKSMYLCPPEISYLTGLQKLTLNNNLLHTFDNGTKEFLIPWNKLPSSLVDLDLSSNSLGEIPSDALDNLPHLTRLSFSHCSLDCLPEGLFAKSSELQKLNLSKNHFTGFFPTTFSGLSALKELNLSKNKQTDYQAEYYLGNHELNKLFAALPPTLEKLDFSHNHFIKPSETTLKNLPNLQELNLSSCSIYATAENPLPSIFSHNLLLKSLDLSNNHILCISQHTFAGPTNLQELNLSNNYLSGVDKAGFMVFSYLQHPTFQKLPSTLVTLNFSANYLEGMPATTLSKLGRLQNLDLSRCQIKNLPKGLFQNTKELQVLHLSYNHLLSLPTDVFNGANKLETLNINNNGRLVNHERGDSCFALGQQHLNLLFAALPNSLKHLNFSFNDLQQADASTLQPLSNLKTLILQQCKITLIPEGIFSSTPQLQSLDVSSNQIATISERTFEGLTEEFQQLNLSYNKQPLSVSTLGQTLFETNPELLAFLPTSLTHLYINDKQA